MFFRQKDISRVLCAALAVAMSHAAVAQTSDYDAQDARLNAAYKKLSQGLDDANRKALRDEERQWILGRDKACGATAGQVLKNACTTASTRTRADELERRAGSAASAGKSSADTAISGDWGYRTDCDFGHYVNVTVTKASPDAEGKWGDGTRNDGSQGLLKGQWRDGKLYVRFCSDDGQQGDYPACPAYSEEVAYFTPQGRQLVWFQRSGETYDRYVALDRVPKGGKAPLDTHCKGGDR